MTAVGQVKRAVAAAIKAAGCAAIESYSEEQLKRYAAAVAAVGTKETVIEESGAAQYLGEKVDEATQETVSVYGRKMLLTLLIARLFYVSYRASTPFSSLLAVGVAGMFLFQTFMNIFMNVGLLPVMGLTLPFFSYGGTSVLTMYAALGIAAGVRMREKPSWLQN